MSLTKTLRDEYLAFGKPNFSQAEIDAISAVVKSGWIGMGPETIKFKEELAEFVGAPYVVTVNSCTSALFLSLLVNGVTTGDEVICPSLTWCSTANAAVYLGARPVFCDVSPSTCCATPDSIQEKLTSKTKAVVVVHMGGSAIEMESIRRVVPDNVAIIEDAAHAIGATFADGSPVGSSGNPTCFSFYANKNLSTGEGGAVALFDSAVAQRLKSLRQHGLSADAWKRYSHPQRTLAPELTEIGYKMNYTDLQASLGRVQLSRQAEFHEIRLAVANRYFEGLSALRSQLDFQEGALDTHHARHLLLVLLPIEEMKGSRDDLVLSLRERNIGASIHYVPLHKMPLYADAYSTELPTTEHIGERIMTLPISASMTLEDVDYVVEHICDSLL